MRVVDEKAPLVVDSSATIYSIEEIRNAKVVRSVVEKLYGVHYSITEVLRENSIYREDAERAL